MGRGAGGLRFGGCGDSRGCAGSSWLLPSSSRIPCPGGLGPVLLPLAGGSPGGGEPLPLEPAEPQQPPASRYTQPRAPPAPVPTPPSACRGPSAGPHPTEPAVGLHFPSGRRSGEPRGRRGAGVGRVPKPPLGKGSLVGGSVRWWWRSVRGVKAPGGAAAPAGPCQPSVALARCWRWLGTAASGRGGHAGAARGLQTSTRCRGRHPCPPAAAPGPALAAKLLSPCPTSSRGRSQRLGAPARGRGSVLTRVGSSMGGSTRSAHGCPTARRGPGRGVGDVVCAGRATQHPRALSPLPRWGNPGVPERGSRGSASAAAPTRPGWMETLPSLGQVLLEGPPGPPVMEREREPPGGDPQAARLRGTPCTRGTGEAAESSRGDLATPAPRGPSPRVPGAELPPPPDPSRALARAMTCPAPDAG